jgi:hypothetical protein
MAASRQETLCAQQSLAKEVGAQIRLVHVVDHPAYLRGFDATGTAGGDLRS